MLIELKTVIGKRFGRLVVLCQEPSRKGHKMVKCKCDCGNYAITRASALLSNNTFSCGCYDKEVRILSLNKGRIMRANGATENGRQTDEYAAYVKMKQRCCNPNVERYPNYGGRGIKVCDRWLNSFENFLYDMGKRPSSKHSIDRLNVNGDYEPKNCRWATEREQAANKTNTIRLVVNGKETYQAELAKVLNITDHAIEYHLRKGKSGDEIVNHFKSKIL